MRRPLVCSVKMYRTTCASLREFCMSILPVVSLFQDGAGGIYISVNTVVILKKGEFGATP